jgi:ubiquinone biosynthesis protein
MNSNISLAIKAITQAMEAASTLDPNLDLLNVINTEAQKQLRTQFTPEKVRETIEKEALSIGREFVRRAPELRSGALKWVENISAGGVKVQLDTSDLSKQVGELDNVLRRVVIGLVVGSLIIGTSIMAVGFSLTSILSIYVLNNTPTLNSLARGLSAFVPGVALFVFVVVALFSVVLVWRVARPPRAED